MTSTLLWLAAAGSQTEAAETAMLAYGESGVSQPRYRTWNGSGWNAQASATNVGSTPQWLVLRGSPTAEHFALATLDNDVDVEVQNWNGSAWSSVTQATSDAGDKTTRVFDLAYEQSSGEILLVYRESGTSNVRYRTYNGSWSGESSYGMTGGSIKWLSLIPKAGTNEIMIVAVSDDATNNSRAAMWNGSSFTNQTALLAGTAITRGHAHGAFEGLTGQGLALFSDNDDTPGYKTLTSGSWSGALNAPSVGATPNWARLASDPASDMILMATLDPDLDINVNVWSGSAWGGNSQIETDTANISRRAFDLAFEQGGTQALVVYDDNSSTLKYRTWDGFGWSSELPGPSGGSAPIWNPQAVTGLSSGQVFAIWGTDTPEIRTAIWNGSSFGSTTVLATSSAMKEYEVFMVATAGTVFTAPILVSWEEVEP